jgi:hypothetical protein
MYVKLHRSGPRTYLRLVESYREGSRVKHRTLANLGRLDRLAEGDVDAVINGLLRATGRAELQPERHAVHATAARELGRTWIVLKLWQQLGLDQALHRALYSTRRGWDAEVLIRVMVINRLCNPESKLGLLRWLPGVVMPGLHLEGLLHQHLLRALDALVQRAVAVRSALTGRIRPLVESDLTLIFYDLTTLRVHGEGELEEELRRYGRNKETAGTARQCMLALMQTSEGIPLDHEVLAGNTAEVNTLLPMLRRCIAHYPIRRLVVVADRGLLSLDNRAALDALRVEGRTVEYILAVPARRYSVFGQTLAKLARDPKKASVRETSWDGHRLVVAYDPERAAEQRRRRRERIDELLALGEALASKLDRQDAGHRERGRRASDLGAYQRFTQAVLEAQMSRFVKADLSTGFFSFYEDSAAVKAAEPLDGSLVLVSNVTDLDAETLVQRYKALADIERSFRVLKSELEIAPLYHRLPERIRAHAMVCFLALLIQRVMRQRLRAAASALSPERALHTVRLAQQYCVYVGRAQRTGITPLTEEQRTVFDQLAVPYPTIDQG